MRAIAPWQGRRFLDLGCGNGFHLPRWAEEATVVVGVEPHPDLAAVAARRVRRLPHVRVLTGTAQQIPLPDASVDVAQARLAYFFGPGSEAGVAELGRVVRRGGTAFVIDNDATRSTFGRWFARGFPMVDPEAVERFWTRHGWHREPLDIVWRFASRADLESVVRIELPPAVAERALAEHGPDAGLEIDYAVNLWWRTFD